MNWFMILLVVLMYAAAFYDFTVIGFHLRGFIMLLKGTTVLALSFLVHH